MEVTNPNRVFISNGVQLPDPNPDMSPDEVRKFYANSRPQLANAVESSQPKMVNGEAHYTFVAAVGAKG